MESFRKTSQIPRMVE